MSEVGATLTSALLAGKVSPAVQAWLQGIDDPTDETQEHLYEMYCKMQALPKVRELVEDSDLTDEFCFKLVEYLYRYIDAIIWEHRPTPAPSVMKRKLVTLRKQLQSTLSALAELETIEHDGSSFYPFKAGGVFSADFPPLPKGEKGDRGTDLYITKATLESLCDGIQVTVATSVEGKDGPRVNDSFHQYIDDMRALFADSCNDCPPQDQAKVVEELLSLIIRKDYRTDHKTLRNLLIKNR